MVLRTKPPQTLMKPRVFIVFISCECLCARRRTPPSPLGTRHGPRGLVEPSWHVLSPGCRAVCIQTSRRRGRRVVRRVEEFDLSQAVGVGWLTAAAGIAIRSASCQQPRVAALVGAAAAIGLCAVARRRHRPSDLRSSCSSCCQSSALTHLTRRARIVRRAKQDTCSCKQCENLVAPLSGGAALEEAAAWEAKQMEAARHAKELLLAEVERLSAARAKGKKGKKKKKNVGVGDTGAARLNEEMLCS